jgi:hypothetical protein
MIKNATISVFAPTVVVDGQGNRTKAWNNYTTPVAGPVLCGVQPANLSVYEKEEWGISDEHADAKKLFMDATLKASVWPYLIVGNRVLCNGVYYDVRGSNQWWRSLQAIMTPVQGGA